MISPKFIEKLRKKNHLTQEVIAKKLGVSRPTYIQVERGERDLTITEAEKLAEVLELSLDNLLKGVEPEVSIHTTSEAMTKTDEQSEIRINIPQQQLEKFRQILLYILRKVGGKPNIGMTALYKLLYFIDFDYYEKYEEQIMGLEYIKNHYGPTPIIFKKIVDALVSEDKIELIKSKYYQHEQRKYLVNPNLKLELSILNGQEKEHIDWELRRLSELNASQLSELSHRDVPWISAENGAAIEYETVFYRTTETSVRDYSENEND